MAYAGETYIKRAGGNQGFAAPKGLCTKRAPMEIRTDSPEKLQKMKNERNIRMEFEENVARHIVENPKTTLKAIYDKMMKLGELPEFFTFEMFANRTFDRHSKIETIIDRKVFQLRQKKAEEESKGASIEEDDEER